MLGWLDDFSVEQQLPVWLEAYEESFRADLLSNIKAHQGTVPTLKERPLAQAAFCIDVRSEPFRRHLEAAGAIETYGYAGFFGIPISHRSYDAEESFPLCPVLLSPGSVLYELPRAGQQEAFGESMLQVRVGCSWVEKLFHDMKHSPVASFLLVDVLGLFFSAALLGKTFVSSTRLSLGDQSSRRFFFVIHSRLKFALEMKLVNDLMSAAFLKS